MMPADESRPRPSRIGKAWAHVDPGDRPGALAELRSKVAEIDANHPAPTPRAEPSSRPEGPQLIRYVGMPVGSENGGTAWTENIPPRYIDGQGGVDRRLMDELAAVGVPAYTLSQLSNGPRTIPQGVPIFIDWLANLETRIPGPETKHRSSIRIGLIRNLIDPAARGNQAAFELLSKQHYRDPPMPSAHRWFTVSALGYIARPRHFVQVVKILDDLDPTIAAGPLLRYLGRVAYRCVSSCADRPSRYVGDRNHDHIAGPDECNGCAASRCTVFERIGQDGSYGGRTCATPVAAMIGS